MLYAKIDDAGNPVDVAKSYENIKADFLLNNTVIPKESVFSNKSQEFGYGSVPLNDPPAPQAGKKIVPDIPIKKSDGSYERTWKYEDVSEEDKISMSAIMREKRAGILKKYVDSISPLRWNNMSESEKKESQDYYKALLNMPDDPAWPFVLFPKIPAAIQ